ncbi:hypothetical protein CVD28_06505 [Bacillus sp. M6-12]|uniref:ribosomal protein L7/L12 n=1 Tax=Bacillus sp. M6-12 TaxID=2054166 RepID=UPI000C77AA4A|nr:ribosomal protein L7/L12 [Bacillus sp. M6-12]PLS18762.1 hypothetical protein CVD28_06505 [Bacillus sp. M6-12]
MSQLLSLPNKAEIIASEKAEIDTVIEQTIALHKENGAMISKLTMDSVTALAASESRGRELSQQGFLKRVWNNLTGKNQKIRAQMDADTTRVQYASQQMIQKLAEQNLLTFDLATAVNNKLNTLALEIDKEFNEVYTKLGVFFKQTRSEIVQLEHRMEKVERNVELLHWNTTIEYQMYNGIEYALLPDEEKIVCISNDFLHKTKGTWSTADLMLLKSTLAELGLPIRQSITSKSFYNYLSQKPDLISRLFADIPLDALQTIEPYQAPVLKGVEKTLKLNADEKYIVDSVTEQLNMAGVAFNDREIKLSIIQQYLKNNAYMNPEVEVNLFDFVLELLVDLNMIYKAEAYTETIDEESDAAGDYDLFLIDAGDSKIKVMKVFKDSCGLSLEEARKLVNMAPATILSRITKDQAIAVENILRHAGAKAITKTYKENVHFVHANRDGIIKLKDPTYFIKTGEYVQDNTKLAEISDVIINPTFTIFSSKKSDSSTKIFANVKGKLFSVFVEHGQIIENGQPIMLILSEE